MQRNIYACVYALSLCVKKLMGLSRQTKVLDILVSHLLYYIWTCVVGTHMYLGQERNPIQGDLKLPIKKKLWPPNGQKFDLWPPNALWVKSCVAHLAKILPRNALMCSYICQK